MDVPSVAAQARSHPAENSNDPAEDAGRTSPFSRIARSRTAPDDSSFNTQLPRQSSAGNAYEARTLARGSRSNSSGQVLSHANYFWNLARSAHVRNSANFRRGSFQPPRASVMSLIERLSTFGPATPRRAHAPSAGDGAATHTKRRASMMPSPHAQQVHSPSQQLTVRKEHALTFLERMRPPSMEHGRERAPNTEMAAAQERAAAGLSELSLQEDSANRPTPSAMQSSPPQVQPASVEGAAGASASASASGSPAVGKLCEEGWSEELEFIYQLLLSEEIHQVLATADASWDSNEEMKSKLSDRDVREFIRVNYSAEAGDEEEEESVDDDSDDAAEDAGVADDVRLRLKGGRRIGIGIGSAVARHRRNSPQSPHRHDRSHRLSHDNLRHPPADEDRDAPGILVRCLVPALAEEAKILGWRDRVLEGDVTLSLLDMAREVPDPLLFVAVFAFDRHGLLGEFGVGFKRLQAFCAALNAGYHADNHFHNATHAADVLYVSHLMLVRSGIVAELSLDPEHVLALLLSAMVHDFRHPGVTNNFLINSQDPLALTYNDRSVLENYHAAEAFKLMQAPNLDMLYYLDGKGRRDVRHLVVTMVLATDMAAHFANVTELVSTAPKEGSHGRAHESSHIESERFLAILLHAADVSHPFRSLAAHIEWSKRLELEFFAQGDIERKLGMPLSPMCDRTQAGEAGEAKFAAQQVGFISAVVKPLLEGVCMHLPGLRAGLMDHLEAALDYWQGMTEPEAATDASGGDARGGSAAASAAAGEELPPVAPQALEALATALRDETSSGEYVKAAANAAARAPPPE